MLFNLITSTNAQKLIDIYQSGTVKLIPDITYGENNDWDKVFETYYDTIYNTPMGNRKSLKLMPDGSVVVNHAYRNYYSKFSPDGTFQKEFGIIGKSGKRFKKTKAIEGIINGNTFFSGLDNMGNMVCFGFDGHYKKTLKLDYMTKQSIPLPNGKIAVVGWVIWKDKFRDFVAIVDYETNKEKVIWEHFTERDERKNRTRKPFNYSYTFEKQGGVSCNTMPFSSDLKIKARPLLACINQKLILTNPTNGEISIYDLDGNFQSKTKMNLSSNFITVEEQKEIQRNSIDKFGKLNSARFSGFAWVSEAESKKAHDFFLNAMKEDLNNITAPISKPYFSTLIQDSDDNLLFFEFPKEQGENKFNVWIYKNDGEFICQSSFVCDDYILQINPSKLVFHNGYIYGLQLLKDAKGVPLRLTRFKVVNTKL